MDPPTANEVKSAIDNMKSGKAPGANGVSAELLKAGGDVITETLTEIFKEIWEEEEIPVDWKTGLIVKLPKKGNLSLCKNLRGGSHYCPPPAKYVNFIDFEKAFDSIHRESLWCILRHYGIPCKIVTIIKMLYEGFKSMVICGQNLTEELTSRLV